MSKFKLKDEVFAISYRYKQPTIIKSFIVEIRLEPFHRFVENDATIYRYKHKLYNEIIPFFEEELFKTHEEARQKLIDVERGCL